MVTEALISIILIAVGFVVGRMTKQHDDSPAWVDGFAVGYMAGMDDTDDVSVHREADRYDA